MVSGLSDITIATVRGRVNNRSVKRVDLPGPEGPRRGVRNTGSRLAVGLFVPACLVACASGDRVVLGNQSPLPYVFGTPVPVAELASDAKTDNPTLTADMLEIFFTSLRDATANSHIWHATRASGSAPFNPPEMVVEVQSPLTTEASPAISADGLTLWFGSDRAGGLGDLDIWASTRATRSSPWSSPTNLVALNSAAKDIPRPLGQHGSAMPLASQRATPDLYQTYLAARAGGSTFSAPTAIPEIATTDLNHVDGFLSDDGLALFFTQGPAGGPADLWVAWRKSTSGPFEARLPLAGINTADYDELDPWLSPDGSRFYFTSNRSGTSQIYTASVSRADSARTTAAADAAWGG